MNRAWIPAGALAGVSVAGLLALGPLTDSMTHATSRSRPQSRSPAPTTAKDIGGSGERDTRRSRQTTTAAPRSRAAAGRRPREPRTATRARSSPIERSSPAAPATASRRRPPPRQAAEEEGRQAPDVDRHHRRAEQRLRPRGGSGSGATGEQGSTPGSAAPELALERSGDRPSGASGWYDWASRGYSSVGRAPGSHPGGQRFEPA